MPIRALALAVCLLVLAGCGEKKEPAVGSTAPTDAATASPTATAQAPPETDIEEAGARAIKIHGDWLAAGEGAVWLSGESEIYRLDPRTGKRTKTIRVRQGPCAATATGFGALWTATCDTRGLARIDARTSKVRHVSLQVPESYRGEFSVGVGAGAVWVIVDGPDGCVGCVLAKVDPKTMRVRDRFEIGKGSVGVRADDDAVWVTNADEAQLVQLDPRDGKVVREVETGGAPRFLGLGEGGAWALSQDDGSVTRVDGRDGSAATIQTPVSGQGGDMSVGGGFAWARGRETLLAQIDPATNEVIKVYGPASGSGAVVVGFDAVWVSAHDVDRVWRLPLSAVR